MRYTGPKDRLSRREGFDLFGKGGKLTRLNVPPGMHGPKGTMRQPSQYGKQLREKQKVKRMYGLTEKQFKKYVDRAFGTKGNTGELLLSLLERRLDNVVYRMGLAETRAQARQIVGHKHITVDGERVNIPSYETKVGQTVALRKKVFGPKEPTVASWLARKGPAGKILRLPVRDDIKEALSEQDIIEFYSR